MWQLSAGAGGIDTWRQASGQGGHQFWSHRHLDKVSLRFLTNCLQGISEIYHRLLWSRPHPREVEKLLAVREAASCQTVEGEDSHFHQVKGEGEKVFNPN